MGCHGSKAARQPIPTAERAKIGLSGSSQLYVDASVTTRPRVGTDVGVLTQTRDPAVIDHNFGRAAPEDDLADISDGDNDGEDSDDGFMVGEVAKRQTVGHAQSDNARPKSTSTAATGPKSIVCPPNPNSTSSLGTMPDSTPSSRMTSVESEIEAVRPPSKQSQHRTPQPTPNQHQHAQHAQQQRQHPTPQPSSRPRLPSTASVVLSSVVLSSAMYAGQPLPGILGRPAAELLAPPEDDHDGELATLAVTEPVLTDNDMEDEEDDDGDGLMGGHHDGDNDDDFAMDDDEEAHQELAPSLGTDSGLGVAGSYWDGNAVGSIGAGAASSRPGTVVPPRLPSRQDSYTTVASEANVVSPKAQHASATAPCSSDGGVAAAADLQQQQLPHPATLDPHYHLHSDQYYDPYNDISDDDNSYLYHGEGGGGGGGGDDGGWVPAASDSEPDRSLPLPPLPTSSPNRRARQQPPHMAKPPSTSRPPGGGSHRVKAGPQVARRVQVLSQANAKRMTYAQLKKHILMLRGDPNAGRLDPEQPSEDEAAEPDLAHVVDVSQLSRHQRYALMAPVAPLSPRPDPQHVKVMAASSTTATGSPMGGDPDDMAPRAGTASSKLSSGSGSGSGSGVGSGVGSGSGSGSGSGATSTSTTKRKTKGKRGKGKLNGKSKLKSKAKGVAGGKKKRKGKAGRATGKARLRAAGGLRQKGKARLRTSRFRRNNPVASMHVQDAMSTPTEWRTSELVSPSRSLMSKLEKARAAVLAARARATVTTESLSPVEQMSEEEQPQQRRHPLNRTRHYDDDDDDVGESEDDFEENDFDGDDDVGEADDEDDDDDDEEEEDDDDDDGDDAYQPVASTTPGRRRRSGRDMNPVMTGPPSDPPPPPPPAPKPPATAPPRSRTTNPSAKQPSKTGGSPRSRQATAAGRAGKSVPAPMSSTMKYIMGKVKRLEMLSRALNKQAARQARQFNRPSADGSPPRRAKSIGRATWRSPRSNASVASTVRSRSTSYSRSPRHRRRMQSPRRRIRRPVGRYRSPAAKRSNSWSRSPRRRAGVRRTRSLSSSPRKRPVMANANSRIFKPLSGAGHSPHVPTIKRANQRTRGPAIGRDLGW